MRNIHTVHTVCSACCCIINSKCKVHVNLLHQVVYQSKDDQVTVIGAGLTLHEALAAAEQLKKGLMHCILFSCALPPNIHTL